MRINIPLQTKIEVVKTLTAYPLVLDKVNIQKELLNTSNELNIVLKQELYTRDELITNLELQIKALEKEKKLFNTQLKKQKLKSVKVGALGLIALITVLVVN